MAYDHQMVQRVISTITIATGQGPALTAAADIGVFAPGLQPLEVRGVALIVTTTCTVTACVVDFYKRPVAGDDTGRTLIKRLNPTLAQLVAGNVIYSDVEGTTIDPGGDIIAEVSTTSTAGNGHVAIMEMPKWQHPGNNTKMIKIA